MRKLLFLLSLLLISPMFVDSSAQPMPLVYDVENTGADCPIPYMPTFSELPIIQALPDPFGWSDGRGRISNFSDWRYRRAEIKAEIEHYEIGEKPDRPDSITASYSGGVLTVNVTVNGKMLTLTSQVNLPAGTGPFPAVIGMNSSSGSIPSTIFTSRNIALIRFSYNQVTTYGSPSNMDPYYQIYPNLNIDNTGQYSAWAWGVSRIIDGLELVQNVLPIDLKHLAVTGCSYAGKLALFAGAFDERIALTISQESGGGGYTTWRYSEEINKTESVETLGKTNYNWFKDDMRQFSNAVSKLPEDHHELMAMVAPRALLVTGNPGWVWLADESGYVGSKAAIEVWNALGVPERFGYSQIGGHNHCAVPNDQIPEIEAFVEKFLLGNNSTNTNIATTPYNTNLAPWITWTTPTLSNGTSFFGKTSLIYPSNLLKDLDSAVTFIWNKVSDAEKYFIQLSINPTFSNIAKSDSTSDTVTTIADLLFGKRYYWRVQAKSIVGAGPWSEVWNFTTFISLPTMPQLVSATPYPNRPGWFTFKWNEVKDADLYFIQTSEDQTFATIFISDSTITDTTKILWTFSEGKKYYWRVQAKNVGGSGPWSDVWNFIASATDVKEEKGIPTEYSISQNYPNPFNPTTKIKFALPHMALTKIIIYDLLGSEIQTLINKELEAGYHEINFDASSDSGKLKSGVYFYRIQSGDFIQTKKMVLMK